MKKCPFCAEDIQDEAIVCKHCGRDLKGGASQVQIVQPRKKTGCVAMGCAGVLGLLLLGWCTSFLTRPGTARLTPAPPPTSLTKEQAEARARAAEPERKKKVAEGLADAKTVVSDAKLCDTPKSIGDAWGKLRLAKKDDPEWREATVLASKLEACRKKVEQSLSRSLQTIMVGQRQEWAKRAEKSMLDQGMEVDFLLSGDKKDRLTVKWVLMNKVAVHKITKDGSMREGALLAQMQKVGFRRVTFSDGYNFGVYYDLEPTDETKGGNTVLAGLGIGTPLKLQ